MKTVDVQSLQEWQRQMEKHFRIITKLARRLQNKNK